MGKAGEEGRGDFVAAIREIEKPEGAELVGGVTLAQRMPSRAEAARFLQKASFGPNKTSIPEVCALGYSGWMDNQFSLPATITRSAMFQNRIQAN